MWGYFPEFLLKSGVYEFLDIDGLRRKLARKLSVDEDGDGTEWEVLNSYIFFIHGNLAAYGDAEL